MVRHAFYIFRRFVNMQGKIDDINIKTLVSALELKQLLVLLSEQPFICFRCRPLGEMWMKNMMKVANVNETSVMLYDEKEFKYFVISINNIMQFEIDERFQAFQPYYHYEVTPSPELA
jgi:hypothetical protein